MTSKQEDLEMCWIRVGINDAGYSERITRITKEHKEWLIGLYSRIKVEHDKRQEGRRYPRKNVLLNWSTRERADKSGEYDFISEEDIDLLYDFVPNGENGFHTIIFIRFLTVTGQEDIDVYL